MWRILIAIRLCLLSVSDLGDILVRDMESQKVDVKWESEVQILLFFNLIKQKPIFGIAAGVLDETAFAASVVEDKSIGVWLFNNPKHIQSLPTDHVYVRLYSMK